ncbi:hypothetical protein BV22DRAFT_730366 [Leucogyrophana mollusca]|uniref:Uncharacterized protein n=1 Tax=Leucogyrophana mollusca TaxID=85980 RepID=A0ACB8B797_9AGAM|nr:hypothetical protein BV22DRAFT_730366 [Leucogyrophana mollusca]
MIRTSSLRGVHSRASVQGALTGCHRDEFNFLPNSSPSRGILFNRYGGKWVFQLLL